MSVATLVFVTIAGRGWDRQLVPAVEESSVTADTEMVGTLS